MTFSYPTDDNSNRIRGVIDNLIGTEDPDDLMLELMDVLSANVTPAPDIGCLLYTSPSPRDRG